MFKRFILLTIAITSLLFSNHANSEQSTNYTPYSSIVQCENGEIPVYHGSSIIKCVSKEDSEKNVPDWLKKYKLLSIHKEENKYRFQQSHEYEKLINNHIKEWFVIGFIIITMMSLPISLLWRFRFKISACLFGTATLLSIIAIPYIFGW
ncbi:hypothetical protein [Bartonella elizabethae]|uniref:Uncharacterized protein n=1 Tax=Bartonella elizabethae F9251 = ATCC 49927 TaxID=1094555 RepID=J1KDJ9_BAREL|nr:hypothetical protein [Bartonella elizabethae]EJF95590.1 hypothetical protein MEE_00827 [Bartonella elizabethae F9251 = ATCC 49927]VEJ41437.1 Uncharacterised protein [Bartonella elizabethae]